ncbi:hypothetical protein BDW59DRAFT_173719 [Aspergillus cavernicola]|uniref:NmrA-like domain-containing protein n=1 Tax=Aspergillus cavernicola TaxID=176166 RepID=A0ABR4I4W5_9EURO
MPTIFVCGATGVQGGAIVNNLLKSNTKAHAIARDPSTPASLALKAAGVNLFKGDFDDEDSLRAAMKDCTGVFLNLMPNLADVTQELGQAKRILSVAKEVGIEHAIYSSGLIEGIERRKYWDPKSFVAGILLSKKAVEAEVRGFGFRYYTILRPGNFMTNYLAPAVFRMHAGLAEGKGVTTAFRADTVVPMVDPNDIGAFGVAAFLDPVRFHGKEMVIVSEMLRFDEVIEILAKATRPVKVEYMSMEEIESQVGTNPFLAGQLMSRDMGDGVDMGEVRAWGIPLGSFGGFLEREKDRVVKTYSL